MIEFTCSCGKIYRFKDEMAGRRGNCRECGVVIQVPEKAKQARTVPQDMPSGPAPWDSGPNQKRSRLEKKCGDSPIYLTGGSRRFFSGAGTTEFRGDVLIIKGPLGPDLMELAYIFLPVVVLGNLLLMILPLPFDTLPVLFNALCLIFLVARPLLMREMRSVRVKLDRIAEVICEGPIVTIRFSAAPVPGLKAVRMFVSRGYRSRFFREFDRMFPETLPKEYRAALERTRIPEAEAEEY